MRGGLDRVVKEIDALTYNARSVVNALIRSTISAGTTNGYKAIRVGIEILLTREDIYRLDKFYKQWEESSFNTTVFDVIASETNSTEALIKHSKIMYLNNDTVGLVDIDSYWLGLIRVANNPKLISNSAPIPINIRTPIFDENMATTKYNQDETYLFPFSYYSVDLLGYSGDGIDHHLDGSSWTISADNYISMETDAFATGGVNSSDTRKTKARRNHDIDANGNPYDITYSTANGYATQARAKYSHASGYGSIVPRGATSGVAIGDRLLASDEYAIAIGGSLNRATGNSSGVFGGMGNTASALYGAVLGGVNNSVGAQTDRFKFPISDSNSSTCITVNNECATVDVVGAYAGKNIIALSGNLSKSYSIGDGVAIHTLSVFSNTQSALDYWQTEGDGFKTQYAQITSVEYLDPNAYPTNVNKGYTIITLSADVAGYKVDGGYITKVKDKNGRYLGYASVAMNNSSIAMGVNQTVVGRFNNPNTTSLFIVGNGAGSNYVTRSNVLEVYNNGISVYGTTYTGDSYILTDSESVYHTFNYIGIDSKVESAGFKLTSEYSYIYVNSYIGLFQTSTDKAYNVMLSSYDSPMILRSGSSVNYKNTPYEEDILISSGKIATVEALSYIQLDAGNDIIINTDSNLILNWTSGLQLYGNTFGALPTNDQQLSHYISLRDIKAYTENGMESTIGGLIKSGFYDILNTDSGNSFTRSYSDIGKMNTCQILNIGSYGDHSSYAWKLMFPTIKNTTDPLPKIAVMFNETDDYGNETSLSKQRATRYLAYADESGYVYNYDSDSDSSLVPSDIIKSIEFSDGKLIGEALYVDSFSSADAINSIIEYIRIAPVGQLLVIKLGIKLKASNLVSDKDHTFNAKDMHLLHIIMKENSAFVGLSIASSYNDSYLGTGNNNPIVHFDYCNVKSLVTNLSYSHCIKVKPVGGLTFKSIISDDVGILSTTIIGVKV